MDQTMHALRIHHRGGPEGLVYEQAPVPSPDIGDVLLRVAGASLTPTELAWPSTWVDRRGLDRSPVIPCHEVSGVVVQLGDGTSGFDLDDEVFGPSGHIRRNLRGGESREQLKCDPSFGVVLVSAGTRPL